jgi:uncharacterized membrane protein YjjP (DUF1212 family)
MAAIGLTLVASPRREDWLDRFGHDRRSLLPVFGGRYLAMSLILGVLLAFGEFRAIAIVFACGAGMGVLDAALVRQARPDIAPHVVAAAICAALAWLCWHAAAAPR